MAILARKDESANPPSAAAAAERSGAAASGALGNTRITFPVSESGRSGRFHMRAGLHKLSSLDRVRKCGRVPVAQGVVLKVTEAERRYAGYGGLHTCGSVWACPVCSAKVAAHRKEEVTAVLEKAHRQGLFISLLTLTQRHHAGQALNHLWGGLSAAWQAVTSGRRWQEYKAQLGLVGFIKATEVTHGASGWHAHLHIVVISEKDPAVTPIFYQRKQGRAKQPYPLEVTTSAEFVANRWAKGLAKHGIDFIPHKGGIDWQTAANFKAVGKYVAKLQSGADGLAAETTLGGFKKARRGNRTPFQILADLLETGDEADARLWWEYEKVSHGKRALTWSNGLREWASLDAEKTDEEIAEEELGGEVVALFTNEAWKSVYNAGAAELLDVVEQLGVNRAYAWLHDRGISFSLPAAPGDD